MRYFTEFQLLFISFSLFKVSGMKKSIAFRASDLFKGVRHSSLSLRLFRLNSEVWPPRVNEVMNLKIYPNLSCLL